MAQQVWTAKHTKGAKGRPPGKLLWVVGLPNRAFTAMIGGMAKNDPRRRGATHDLTCLIFA